MGEVWRCGPFVVKCHHAPPAGLYEAEAKGLASLARSGGKTPHVHHVDHDGLVLEYLEPGPTDGPDLANQLSCIHSQRRAQYGWAEPVFIGRLPLPRDQRADDWQLFWKSQRIDPLLALTTRPLGALKHRIISLLESYSPPTEGPCLLHGDLWSGNVVMSKRGASLIDPSVWCGERGVDLAMMRLFGGFPQSFWSSYEERLPIPREVEEAIPYYQLYYILVHVHFFGVGYCREVSRVLEQYGH